MPAASRQSASTKESLGKSMLDRARALVSVLREREAECNAQAKVPDETIKAFEGAGFFRILQPERWGGYELPPIVYADVARILAEGCISSAWVYGVVAVHNWQMALFPDQAARDVWGQDDSVRIASSYMPVGKVVPVDGGYRISGRWMFSTGCQHCTWTILGSNIPPRSPGEEPEARCFLVPRSDYRIVENWKVMGLQGTGSHDLVIEDAFVPEHRTVRDLDMFEMKCPGHAVNRSPRYNVPFAQLFNRTVSTTALGCLKRALDEYVQSTRARTATYTGARMANTPRIQNMVSEVARTLEERLLIYRRDCEEILQHALNDTWTLEPRAALGASCTSTVDACMQAIDKLMLFSGAKAMYGGIVQRAFLDMHMARGHTANNPFPYAENHGGMLFGLPHQTIDI
ncbi:MAG: acyl-CoA dehydrogenase family protein [Proteobacteria bacterium]|nr:acyl-CoA dehydrogenase family protein [Pseudomonadota bacterium]